MRAHLRSCPRCAGRARSMAVLNGWLRGLSRKRPGLGELDLEEGATLLLGLQEKPFPPELDDRIRAALGEAVGDRMRRERRDRALHLFQSLAAAAVLVAAGMLSFRTVEPAPRRTPGIRVVVTRSLYFHRLDEAARAVPPLVDEARGRGNSGAAGRTPGRRNQR